MIYPAFNPPLSFSRARYDPIENVHNIYRPIVLVGAPLRSIKGREWILLGVHGTENIVCPAIARGRKGEERIERPHGRGIIASISSNGRSGVSRGEERGECGVSRPGLEMDSQTTLIMSFVRSRAFGDWLDR